jgi:uncharacterized membrane protein YgcG
MTSMQRRLVSCLAAVALWVVPALPVAAQTVDEVADEVAFRGYYLDEGVGLSINDMESLVGDHPDMGFVALVDDPPGGADLFADQVLAAIEDPDTVIVLSATEVGVSSAAFDDAAVDEALDTAFATEGDTYLTDFDQVAGALGDDTGASVGGGFPLGWVLLVVVIGGVWWLMRRNKSRTAAMVAKRMDTAKAEIRQQMSVIANEILEFSDRVDQEQHPDAVAHYRSASDTFKDAEERLEGAQTDVELEQLSDDLDIARWEMAAAEGLAEGSEVPPRPEEEKPEPCFFDPTHGTGVEQAQLQTAAGNRMVMVCRADADRLRRGERPEPRSIDVGGRVTPAPQAPRTHGGGGMDWLDAFSILVGGMGAGADYRWGSGRRGGMFGGGSMGGGGLGTPLPSRRSGSSRSSGSAGRTSGRSARPSRSIGRGRRSR